MHNSLKFFCWIVSSAIGILIVLNFGTWWDSPSWSWWDAVPPLVALGLAWAGWELHEREKAQVARRTLNPRWMEKTSRRRSR